MKTVTLHSAGRIHITLGWGVLVISLITYLLTLEPTISYWDCPEYVACAYGVQPGHPPGNPMWMLAARFFINFAPDASFIPLMVNALSAVCSALTVLLTFLATALLAGQLLPHERPEGRIPVARIWLREGAGIVAALALCWSDTFWFSAVEAEVYAFSSLTTALLFWMALVWSKNADKPHSDRLLIAIAYVLGVSIGVHELNLLCLPCLLLIVAFTLRRDLRRISILWIMLVAIIAIALVLYGLIPGFTYLASRMELLCVNAAGMPYNSGTVIWWILVFASLIAAVASLNEKGSRRRMLLSVILFTTAVGCSGLFFFSGNAIVGISLTLIASAWPLKQALDGRLNVRRMRVALWSLGMVLLGFSTYASVIIRSAAMPPLNTCAPADIFAFQRYFSREQYGKSPLIYGAPFTAKPLRMRSWTENSDSSRTPQYNLYRLIKPKKHIIRTIPGMPVSPRSVFATSDDSARNASLIPGGHGYVTHRYTYDVDYPPEVCMWFPRMHSHSAYDMSGYGSWSGADTSSMLVIENPTLAVDSAGRRVEVPEHMKSKVMRPTYMQNLRFFMVYQISYMYWRYFMWNFVGRQNDFTGRGEPDCGNFITGFSALDTAMLDNIDDAPDEMAAGNKGRNVYYFLPLLLGMLGIAAQCRSGVTGRRQAIVLLVLFIVTGIAIVFYLNQGPGQARDRDYSFAGSFYAWCMWMGLGVIGLRQLLVYLLPGKEKVCAIAASLLAICVPLQMLSQTADDHDRSHRTVARDLALNQLKTLKPRAIIFAAEDNYLFPLIYLQQVERQRPDVRMVSLPYLVTDWYASQLRLPLRDSSRLELTVPPGLVEASYLSNVALGNDMEWTEALPALKSLYRAAEKHSGPGFLTLPTPRLFIDMDGDTVRIDLSKTATGRTSFLHADQILALDLIATNAASPDPRPIYVVTGVNTSLLGGQLSPWLSQVGTVSELNPSAPRRDAATTARMALYRWEYGGAGLKPTPYFDPVAAHNLSVHRRAIIQSAIDLSTDPATAPHAVQLLELIENKMPRQAAPYEAVLRQDSPSTYTTEGLMIARAWRLAGEALDREEYIRHAHKVRAAETMRLRQYKKWKESLRPAYRSYVSFRVEHLIDALDSIATY